MANVLLKAVDGFRAKVFLDGVQIQEVTEIEAAPTPNTPVQGKVRFIINIKRDKRNTYLDGQGVLTDIKSGEVYWEPLD